MKTCLTRKLFLSDISGCLVEMPECGYALPFGFSYLCRHPDHTKFRADVQGLLTSTEINELYDSLREKRRDAFLACLDETNRNQFNKTDFFGQPLASIEMANQQQSEV